ncbi:hypothetical protein ABES58_05305 [Paenibacillus lautus]|uniref:hypothetical protein n=1 Tax=Paenibacillus lautus TaxID=1401 RepID=UPI003D2C6344
MIDKHTEYAFVKIKFIERYKNLAAKYQFNISESFENYESNQVVKIMSELGYVSSFNKKEKFFKITETQNDYKFQFVISLKYGVAEFIWSVWENSELRIGGTWGILKEQLDGLENDKVRKPVFRNYEELKELLADAFLIYEDFKREYMH